MIARDRHDATLSILRALHVTVEEWPERRRPQ
jgi:hypothetical protein